MVPTIPTGAIVIASPFPYEQLALGDIVVFKDRRIGLVMHRLHAKVAGGWTTKGDGNDTIDHDAMTEWNYVGKVTLHVVP
jgi:signal peptidase I